MIGWKLEGVNSFQVRHLYLRKTHIYQSISTLEFLQPTKRKTNLILTLTHRAFAICSSERLSSELDKIKFILQTNENPEYIIKSSMAKKMTQCHALPKFGPEKCPVYLRLQWFGKVSTRFEKQKNLLSNSTFPLWNHTLFVLPTSFSPLPTRMLICTACFAEKQCNLSIFMPL